VQTCYDGGTLNKSAWLRSIAEPQKVHALYRARITSHVVAHQVGDLTKS
jgi:hypothetical protein